MYLFAIQTSTVRTPFLYFVRFVILLLLSYTFSFGLCSTNSSLIAYDFTFVFCSRVSVQVCVSSQWEASFTRWAWSSSRVTDSSPSLTPSGISLSLLEPAFITTPSGGTCTYRGRRWRPPGDWHHVTNWIMWLTGKQDILSMGTLCFDSWRKEMVLRWSDQMKFSTDQTLKDISTRAERYGENQISQNVWSNTVILIFVRYCRVNYWWFHTIQVVDKSLLLVLM